ncbi:MAG: hypothetical protein GY835_08675 [bacterium]|nr:hypothetical protein [bacterium]
MPIERLPANSRTGHKQGSAHADTIQGGLGFATSGDTVLVASGTYTETNINMVDGVVLRGETGQPDGVTLDAQQAERVLTCVNIGSTSRVEGFTFANGFVVVVGGPEGNGAAV